MTYQEFLDSKRKHHVPTGVTPSELHSQLFPFQKAVCRKAHRLGRSAMFAGTGTGKTIMQGEFLRHMDGLSLIVAPLGVMGQTVIELQQKLGFEVAPVRHASDIPKSGACIVNYDRLGLFDDVKVDAVVLDESSILKSHDGAYRRYIQERFRDVPYKLACTATPAPNDYMELGTHAEFVGAMTRAEMLATFFVHDGGDTSKWRLKRHAVSDFWQWVSTWATVFSHPRDIGFDQPGFDLPELHIHDHRVDIELDLFDSAKVNATRVFQVLRDSSPERAKITASIVAESNDPVIVWCNTNDEQDDIENAIPWLVGVRGSDSDSHKEDALCGFGNGKYNGIVTKPKIAGFGMNWQRCNRMVFCGVTYSFEQVYQSIRRCWRFGQERDVHVHFVTCNAQESIMSALSAKEEAFNDMAREMRKYCRLEVL